MRHLWLRPGYTIFAVSVFLSAFLLFAVQPMASKHLLPYFGGSSSVWATSLVFFTTILFLGYAYVYVVTSLRSKHQMMIHGGAIVVTVGATLLAIASWGSIYPPLDWITGSQLAPALRVLVALTLSVGIPYFLLSTTGPLLQYWYGVTSEKEPYKLYALSNAGSLIALLAYPFLIEPNISLSREEVLWSVLFFIYAILLTLVTLSIRRIPPHVRATAAETGTRMHKLQWVALAALPAFLLVATTTVLTQLISPVPLLWIMPLALYLLTFILAFSGYGSARFLPLFVFIAACSAYMYTPAHPMQIVSQVTAYLVLLFFASFMCHAELYRRRPATAALPFFYLCTSFGGMIGTMAASLLSPVVFNDFFEFPFGLAITAALAVILIPVEFYPRLMNERAVRMVRIIAPFVFAAMLATLILNSASTHVLASRSFYGAVQIKFQDEATVLMNGTTMHGLQPVSREWSYIPTSYYTASSGLGRAIRAVRDSAQGDAVRVGVIGLGTGSIGVYCEPKDTFTFYEIDPHIEQIARSYFSYLSRCEGSEVKIGDGRIVLASESLEDGRYDLFAVDAFTDDAIPAHLLTNEAVALYMDHLSAKGILAIHTSNRFLLLYPMILSIAREQSLSAMVVFDNAESGYLGTPSQWVLLAKDPKVLQTDAFIGVAPWTAKQPLPAAWTDNYTSLFSVLSVPLPF
ncbi:MAG: fused MFS/spermidine synthase [Candidatus Pacebacteria bacterium]|nr:fused MFS/spermidine synthase [Candidatus Paceibacterota bacterium]